MCFQVIVKHVFSNYYGNKTRLIYNWINRLQNVYIIYVFKWPYVYKFTTLRQIVFQILYLYDSCLCVYISINKIDVELLILVEASVCQINF